MKEVFLGIISGSGAMGITAATTGMLETAQSVGLFIGVASLFAMLSIIAMNTKNN